MGQQPVPHHNYADEYMGSAKPFSIDLLLPASTDPNPVRKLELPFVSRFIVLDNHESGTANKSFLVAFYPEAFTDGSKNYFELLGGDMSPLLEIKCKDIWLRSSNAHTVKLCIMVGCTNIPRDNFPDRFLAPTSATGNRINVFTV